MTMWRKHIRKCFICPFVFTLAIYLLFFLLGTQTHLKARIPINQFRHNGNVSRMASTTGYDVIHCHGDQMSNIRELVLNKKSNNLYQPLVAIKRRCYPLISITKYRGRIGNQLFQMAVLLGTALKLGYLPVVATNTPLAKWFDLSFLKNERMSNVRAYKDSHCAIYNNNIEVLDHRYNWTLDGYFQSWKYFSHANDFVRSALRIKKEFQDAARSFLSKITKKGVPNVGVHIRRGDMVRSGTYGYNVADAGFIKKAMNFYRNRFDRVQFIIVSDGMSWCVTHIKGKDIHYSPFHQPISDLALLALCDHVIVTSGTFGWWGAWLANGTTVFFKGYPLKGSKLYNETNFADYYPTSWIGM